LLFATRDHSLMLCHIIGVSSSAALTGAFSMSLNEVLGMGLDLSHLSQVDFGEYFLGKSAGAADKMAQLSAKRSEYSSHSVAPFAVVDVTFIVGVVVINRSNSSSRVSTRAFNSTYELSNSSGYIVISGMSRATINNC
jgi:uncharacterized membrane protein AbrB (regulator of aidB expression)